MLYNIGGMLKVEARNYMETKQKESSQEFAGPLNEENTEIEKHLESTKRELNTSDMVFFE